MFPQSLKQNEGRTTKVMQASEENFRKTTEVVRPCEENERRAHSEKNARYGHKHLYQGREEGGQT